MEVCFMFGCTICRVSTLKIVDCGSFSKKKSKSTSIQNSRRTPTLGKSNRIDRKFRKIAIFRLATFLSIQRRNRIELTNHSFLPLLHDFLAEPQYKRFNKDIVIEERTGRVDASRVLVRLRNVGAKNQSRAMHLFRQLASTSVLSTGVYADFFLVTFY